MGGPATIAMKQMRLFCCWNFVLCYSLLPCLDGIWPSPTLTVTALDNGLALKPLMGWRNWISMHKDVNQTAMENIMYELANASRLVDGKPTSLIDLGYNRIGLDDAWQLCGGGINGSFHDEEGKPIINTTRFPSMKNMTSRSHALGLKFDWYMNNCVCMENQNWPEEYVDKHYRGDVAAIIELGFDGVKLDSCGRFRNLTRWATLLNETGVPILIENCHQGMTVPCGTSLTNRSCGVSPAGENPPLGPTEENFCSGTTAVSNCPYHLFRSSGDVQNNWQSVHGNVLTTIKFAGPVPRSRPGGWAYPDTMEVGRLESTAQDRLLFGLYCITSSPLILGHDLTDTALTDKIWHIISNKDAIMVQQIVSGYPGTRIKAWDLPTTTTIQPGNTVVPAACSTDDHTQIGWKFDNTTGLLFGPEGYDGSKRCLDTASEYDLLTLNPCNSSMKTQQWHANASGYIHRSISWCLAVASNLGVEYGVVTQPCNKPGATFEFTSYGQLKSTSAGELHQCLAGRKYLPARDGSLELWAKPLISDNSSVAVLVANLGSASMLSITPAMSNVSPSCSSFNVYDVWNQVARDTPVRLHENIPLSLDTYESSFLILRCN